MISLEQIRLLEGKISRAIDLIRVLKEENTTLRRGLDSAQARMKELETLVEGFKSDQKEIESVIVRTLKNLDDLEDAGAETTGGSAEASLGDGASRDAKAPSKKTDMPREPAAAGRGAQAPAGKIQKASAEDSMDAGQAAATDDPKGELDIF
jgi:FtsZ-binding cell division protein ZapB